MDPVNNQPMEFLWPADHRTVDLRLLLSRTEIVSVKSPDPSLKFTAAPTRLRIESNDERQRVANLVIEYRGESPLPSRPQVLGATNEEINNISEAEIAAYIECRRCFASVPGDIGKARQFFFELDKRTKQGLSGANSKQFRHIENTLYHLLMYRYDPSGGSTLATLTPSEVDIVTRVFVESSPYCEKEFEQERQAYLLFAAGLLEHPCPINDVAAGPNTGYLFFFAEFAFAAIKSGNSASTVTYWTPRLPVLVLMQRIYMERFSSSDLPFGDLLRSTMKPEGVISYERLQEIRNTYLPRCETDPKGEARTAVRRIGRFPHE